MPYKSKIWYLERFNMMKKLNPTELSHMEKVTVMKKVRKNDFIHFPDEAGRYVYFVKEGNVKIVQYSEEGKEDIQYVLSKGNIFGELALMDNEENREIAIALSDCLVCFVSTADMQEMMLNHTSLCVGVRKILGLRIKKLERKLESLLFKDSKTRVIEFLEELRKEYGVKKNDSFIVKNFLTHADLAKLTATSRQTVTSVFNELREQKLIDYDKSYLTFKNTLPS